MPQPKTQVVHLTTIVTNDGDFCVRRAPAIISADRADLDSIVLSNENAADPEGESDITIMLDPAAAANLFDPIPEASITLAPGGSVTWTLKAVIAGPVSLNYLTVPDNCAGQDQGDVIVQ
jgi:hypothetical protein